MKRLRLGALASGGGSNLQAIIDRSESGNLNADVVVVVSNNSKSGALERARKHNIKACHISTYTEGSEKSVDMVITEKMKEHEVDIVILAGYMKKIGLKLLEAFEGKILNIHPALLPKFGGDGMYGRLVHEAVLEEGEKESGPTVHIVDSEYDRGPILEQRKIPVLPDDTPETLAARVLIEEHKIYPDVIQRISEQCE